MSHDSAADVHPELVLPVDDDGILAEHEFSQVQS